MGKVIIAGLGSSGMGSDDCTSTGSEVLKGYTAITRDSDDEVVEGSLELNGDAVDSQVLAGKTFYNTNPKYKRTGGMVNQGNVSQTLNAGEIYNVPSGYHNGSGKVIANSLASQTPGSATASRLMNGDTAWVNGSKLTGTMAIQSILSFSAAVYSSTAISFTWQNPAIGPFSGVIIVGKTGSYPTSTNDGTRYYKGFGSNSMAYGVSGVTVSNFLSGVTYYFRVFSYAILNGGEWVHATSYTAALATTKGQQIISSSGTFSVPAGVRSIDVFMVGGGGGGYEGSKDMAGGGGGGGYTNTVKSISVSPGQTFNVVIGTGGSIGLGGGATYFGSYSAAGGKSGFHKDGGSGGGGGTFVRNTYAGGTGGSDGGNGGYNGGTGQGTSTRAFGDTNGTLYSGGGGGGGNNQNGLCPRGVGGSGGGGNGADAFVGGSAGSTNTGGGGGGGYAYSGDGGGSGYPGGSGICIVRWGY